MSLAALSLAATTAALRLSDEAAGGHGGTWLGLPLWVWQLLNLVLFFAVLLYFVARPMAAGFRKRQAEIEERRKAAEEQRASVEKLSTEIRERTAALEREIAQIREQGIREGELARAELAARADEEGARIARQAEEEIARRLAMAREQLTQAAGELTTSSARQILTREIGDADRQRLLSEGVEKLKASR